MKIAAIIEEFNDFNENQRHFIQTSKKETGADFLIAVMSGDFLQQGVTADSDKYTRAGKAIRAGVDLVIELPVYCALSSPDTYAFAAVALLENLHCVDELCIACDSLQTNLLSQIAQFLFMETRTYQNEIRTYRNSGMTFYDAQAKAVERQIPGAKEVLQNPVNIFAAEYLRAAKRMYSTMKPRFIQTPGISPMNEVHGDNRKMDYFSALLNYSLNLSQDKMNGIYGGTAMLTEHMLSLKDAFTTLEDFATRLSTPTRSTANIRRYLLSLALNIRKSDIAISRLYNFAVYARIIGKSASALPLIGQIQASSWLPVLIETVPKTTDHKDSQTLDPAKQMMADLDHRAHHLYHISCE